MMELTAYENWLLSKGLSAEGLAKLICQHCVDSNPQAYELMNKFISGDWDKSAFRTVAMLLMESKASGASFPFANNPVEELEALIGKLRDGNG